jgi:hypothetical protein
MEQERTLLEEACRAPIHMAFTVRREIMKQRNGQWLKKETLRHPCNEETRMCDCVGQFLKAFSGLKKFMTTPICPFPFPWCK